MRLSIYSLVLLAIKGAFSFPVDPADPITVPGCSPANGRSIFYTISPSLLLAATDTDASDLVALVRKTNPALFNPSIRRTDYIDADEPKAGLVTWTLRATINNFLSSPCSFRINAHIGQSVSPEQTMRVFEAVFNGTSLIWNPALHKTGSVRAERAHTLLPMYMRAMFDVQTASRGLIPAGFDYLINCPPTVGPPKGGIEGALETKNSIGIVKDCDWCKKTTQELPTVCEPGWVFGSAKCEGC